MLRGSTQDLPNFLDVPFEIPCTESLAGETLDIDFVPPVDQAIILNLETYIPRGEYVLDATAEDETPFSLSLGLEAYAESDFVVWFKEFTADAPSGPTISVSPTVPVAVKPGEKAAFKVALNPNWPVQPSQVSAASSPAPIITATLVYSLGPTARITRTLLFSQMEQVFVPVVAKQWSGGW